MLQYQTGHSIISKCMKWTKMKLTLARTPEMNTVGLGGLKNKRSISLYSWRFPFCTARGQNKQNHFKIRLSSIQDNNRHWHFWTQILKNSHNECFIHSLNWLHQLVKTKILEQVWVVSSLLFQIQKSNNGWRLNTRVHSKPEPNMYLEGHNRSIAYVPVQYNSNLLLLTHT